MHLIGRCARRHEEPVGRNGGAASLGPQGHDATVAVGSIGLAVGREGTDVARRGGRAVGHEHAAGRIGGEGDARREGGGFAQREALPAGEGQRVRVRRGDDEAAVAGDAGHQEHAVGQWVQADDPTDAEDAGGRDGEAMSVGTVRCEHEVAQHDVARRQDGQATARRSRPRHAGRDDTADAERRVGAAIGQQPLEHRQHGVVVARLRRARHEPPTDVIAHDVTEVRVGRLADEATPVDLQGAAAGERRVGAAVGRRRGRRRECGGGESDGREQRQCAAP